MDCHGKRKQERRRRGRGQRIDEVLVCQTLRAVAADHKSAANSQLWLVRRRNANSDIVLAVKTAVRGDGAGSGFTKNAEASVGG